LISPSSGFKYTASTPAATSSSDVGCGAVIALGHTVKLMPPAYVKAYVKRNKNDAADAEAICEAVTRPSMRFVPVKDADQQSVLMTARIAWAVMARGEAYRSKDLIGQAA
jgi:hypothetical protein